MVRSLKGWKETLENGSITNSAKLITQDWEEDQEEFERELRRKQKQHLERVKSRSRMPWRPCLHDLCPSCFGTGIKVDGSRCVHMLSCPCPKCTPQ